MITQEKFDEIVKEIKNLRDEAVQESVEIHKNLGSIHVSYVRASAKEEAFTEVYHILMGF